MNEIGKNVKELYQSGVGKRALIIGNGRGREGFNLKKLSADYDVTFGCNVLYIHFFPTYLVTQNQNILLEMIDKKVWEKSKIIYQIDISIENLKNRLKKGKIIREGNFYYVEDRLWKGCDSGFIATQLALQFGIPVIHFVGVNMTLSNVYGKSHEEYKNVWRVYEERRQRGMEELKVQYLKAQKTRFQELLEASPDVEWEFLDQKQNKIV